MKRKSPDEQISSARLEIPEESLPEIGYISTQAKEACAKAMGKPTGLEHTRKSIRELFERIQAHNYHGGSFHSRLERLHEAVHDELWRERNKDGFVPPEMAVGALNMCGYSAMAITEGIRKITGDNTAARTVLGYFDPMYDEQIILRKRNPKKQSPYHYWTEISVGRRYFFCCATFAQFDSIFYGSIIFDENTSLPDYGLHERYATDIDASPEDLRTLSVLKLNGDNLPLTLKTDNAIKAYDRLVRCITDDPEHTFFK